MPKKGSKIEEKRNVTRFTYTKANWAYWLTASTTQTETKRAQAAALWSAPTQWLTSSSQHTLIAKKTN